MEQYGKILTIGDPLLKELFDGEVVIQEKVDGSQFRFGLKDGKPWYGSKSVLYDDEHPPDKMFNVAMQKANGVLAECLSRDFKDVSFFCEFLKSQQHNSLKYGRVPKNNLVLFDVYNGMGGYWANSEQLLAYSTVFGFEPVPVLFKGVATIDTLAPLLETESVLGGVKIEGVVVKNYGKPLILYGKGQTLMGKFVREEFKELNKAVWGVGESPQEKIAKMFPSEPRWMKTVQHAKEQGLLSNSPKDFAVLLPALEKDFYEEAEAVAKDELWKRFKREIAAIAVNRPAFVTWYKQQLMEAVKE